jgi:guanylate kinase
LIVVSGPSGTGKTSIVAAVLERTDTRFSVSATTRSARPGETDGADYLFVTNETFETMRMNGEVLEWAEYGGNLYGTPGSQVLPHIDAGNDVVLDIENEGAKQIRASYPEALMIFIRPPTLQELADRLAGRGDTSDEDMERRLGVAEEQMSEAPGLYDHIIVNDDLAGAISQVLDILNKPAAAR